jgi:hypothetical protein
VTDKRTSTKCPVTAEELALSAKAQSGGGPICPLTGGLQCALTETRETVIRLETKFDDQAKDLHTLKLEVYGNGKPGLKTEMVKLRMVMGGVKWAAGILGGAILLDIALRVISVLAPHAPVVTDTTTKVLGGG